ncbi:MAG: hypothetical protein BWK80_53140 [Desulfobacteraceae bacterium IS3]|nr:MAG: hypothetical protein BWK80_53140 [Desulfobacteraceae bacterium IS3]
MALMTMEVQPKKKKKDKPDFELMVQEDNSDDADEQYERIFRILGIAGEEEADVTDEKLQIYFDFLKQHLELPCIVTGIGDYGCFRWEEYYTFGPGNKSEYEKLKKKYASYRDEYELICLGSGGEAEEDFNENDGIFVRTKRIKDNESFVLTLADLEVVDKQSENAQLTDDYAIWFINFR